MHCSGGGRDAAKGERRLAAVKCRCEGANDGGGSPRRAGCSLLLPRDDGERAAGPRHFFGEGADDAPF